MSITQHDDAAKSLGASLIWALDAENGATDLSGNGRDGEAGGSITIGGFSVSPLVDGSTCTDFDGTNDRITIDTDDYHPYEASANLTFCGWAYRDTDGSSDNLFGHAGTADGEPQVQIEGGANEVQVEHGAETDTYVWADAWPGTGEWVHWALTYDDDGSGGEYELVINGVSQGAVDVPITVPSGQTTFRLGVRRTSSAAWDGKMAHFAVFEKALTAAEIGLLYQTGIGGAPAFRVSQLPPDDAAIYVANPDGSDIRAAGDEEGLPLLDWTHSSTLPGGYESLDGTVALATGDRVPLVRFGGVRLQLHDRQLVWEGIVESSPESEDDRTSRISALGYQYLLDGPGGITFLGCHNDLADWDEPPNAYRENASDSGVSINQSFQVGSGDDGLVIAMDSDRNVESSSRGEFWWSAPQGQEVAEVQYVGAEKQTGNMTPTIRAESQDDGDNTIDTETPTLDLALQRWTPSSPAPYIALRDTPNGQRNKTARSITFHAITLFGDHDLPRGTINNENVPDGLYPADVIEYLLDAHVPQYALRRGGAPTIASSGFALPHLAWLEPTPLREILDELAVYEGGKEWAVWDGPTFYYQPRRAFGRTWVARSRDGARFRGAGQTVAPAYNAVKVVYELPNGRPRTAGPPGSDSDIEDTVLRDYSSDNPVNASPYVGDRVLLIDVGRQRNARAVDIGEQALADATRERFTGSVELGRYAELDGQLQPTSLIRAGDRVINGDVVGSPEMPLAAATYSRDGGERPFTGQIDNPSRRLDARLARIAARPDRIRVGRIRAKRRRERRKLRRELRRDRGRA